LSTIEGFSEILVDIAANLPDYNYLGRGWSWLNRRIDDYDVEWQTWKVIVSNFWYFYVIHAVAAEVYRSLKLKVRRYSLTELHLTSFFPRSQHISFLYFVIGALSCITIFNVQFFLMILLQTFISFFVSSLVKKKRHIWILACIWLAVLNYLKFETNYKFLLTILNLDEAKIHEFLIIFAWVLLKNISFNLERVGNELKNDRKFNIVNCLGYVFYFPTFFSGPHVIYSRYSDMLEQKYEAKPLSERYQSLILNLVRFSFWFFLTEFAMHFFYFNSIVTNLDLKLLNSLTFFGVGYCYGQFFNNKYIIHYGVPITFSHFDNIDMPKTPRCICRVHKYADMWKWFDHGLYEFLFKYIYTCMCHRRSSVLMKVFSGFMTFLFIYIWHGFFDYILVWSVLNCVCIVLEKFIYYYIEGENFRKRALEILKTDNNVHRLHAFIGSHILIPAILSNFFFFGGIEVGWEFVRRTYLNGFLNYVKISSCIYFLYPVAEAIKRREKMNKT
jgi:protein-cysteine N-palmitoyltransferase HHAT